MDPKYFKRQLPDQPSEEEYIIWWINLLRKPDNELLDALFSVCSPQSFQLVEECTSFESAILALDRKFAKSSSSILNRHKLRSCKQGQESIEEYMNRLKQLAKKCSTPAMSAEEHRSQLIMDAFIAGISSATIRQRLLETEDTKISLSNLYNQALSMEMAMNDVQSISNHVGQSLSLSATKTTSCLYCGGASQKSRSMCPAKILLAQNARSKVTGQRSVSLL